ncbi:MAG: Gfo/Idh/MocA family oxidoreductase [Monoglobales bacterium]
MKKIRFGIIGCGLMGKEIACAAMRWCQLDEEIAAPEIVGVCDMNPAAREWFTKNIPTVKYSVEDYRELLEKDDIDAIYCAVPHNLHQQFYTDIIKAGKHLLGEKPFGIDMEANNNIMKAIDESNVVVRCSSEFPFFPACQQLINWIREGKFGKILEIHAGFNHSSDMDLEKPINWKRRIEINGEYGCMGDLGIHTQHIPFRMGFIPKRVYASLTKAVTKRPDGKGGMAECLTWDNATLACDVEDDSGYTFPMYLETKRMSPGSTNEWFFEIYGLDCSAKFSTTDPNAFLYTESWGKEQGWCRVEIGNKPMIKTITGSIFEFGFSDSILQMVAAFCSEIEGKEIPFGLFTPEETRLSHKLLTAALISGKERRAVEL